MAVDMNMKIMAVDDSGTMRMMMKQILKKVGFSNVTMATDGDDAISKLKADKVALIISDWNMPNKDGLELLEWVRASAEFKDIPFIMATAQADKTQQEKVKSSGGQSLIPKPFTEKELKDRIDIIFGEKSEDDAGVRERKIINGKVQMKVAHIQITDHLALGVLKHQIASGDVTPKYFELETQRMPGWNPVVQALEKGDVDGAFVLAPIAMDLFAFETPIKLVLLAHKNGSTFVRNRKIYTTDTYDTLDSFYKYKVVNIPHKMSIHNMLAHKFLKEMGLKPGVPGKKAINVRFEVVPPIKMPIIMKENESIGGFMVAEPIASNAIAKGIAQLEFVSSSLWNNHPCCIAAMQDDFIQQYPDAVYEFTELLVKAGKFIETNKDAAAEIAVNFLDPEKKIGLSVNVLKSVLSQEGGIIMNDLFPVLEDLDQIQRYMNTEMGIGKLIDVEKFVDLKYAEAACK